MLKMNITDSDGNFFNNVTLAEACRNVSAIYVQKNLEYLKEICSNYTSFNNTNNTSRPFVLPYWQKLLWSALFSVMVIFAALGNILVIWVILGHRRMRTVTNYFLLNLSIADLMMATLNVIFNFIFMIDSHWPFGTYYCQINNFVANLTVSSSVFSIMAISIDRYVATLRTIRKRMSKVTAWTIIILIWLSSALLATPSLLYSKTKQYKYIDGIRTVCFLHWPDGPDWNSKYDFVYNIIFMNLTYTIPVISLSVTYGIISRELWGSSQLITPVNRHQEVLRSKRKVIRMLIVMVLTFASCWLPYHIYFIYKNVDSSILHASYVQHLFLAFYWLAMSNTMFNPFIYYWMSAKFRDYFRRVLCCLTLRRNLKRPYPCSPPGEKNERYANDKACETPQRALMCVYTSSCSYSQQQRYKNCYINEAKSSLDNDFI